MIVDVPSMNDNKVNLWRLCSNVQSLEWALWNLKCIQQYNHDTTGFYVYQITDSLFTS